MLLHPSQGQFARGAPSLITSEKLKGAQIMITPKYSLTAVAVALCAFAGAALADAGSADQQEIWKVEHQQWQMAATKDDSWIESLLHPNLRYWETGTPMPRDRASLKHWSRYGNDSGTVLEWEIFPISATITGNVAVVQYNYMMARENLKKEREMVTGHYTDVLMKDGGKWLFIAWAGGDDPKK